jgi:hypothetical protein
MLITSTLTRIRRQPVDGGEEISKYNKILYLYSSLR